LLRGALLPLDFRIFANVMFFARTNQISIIGKKQEAFPE
jgi:hypothetical protein